MAIDLVTGEHICYGLYFGSGCESCRKKYPHLLAKTPEEIERGKEHMRQVGRLLDAAIENGVNAQQAAAINDFSFGTAVKDLPQPQAERSPAMVASRSTISLAKLAPGFVQDMLAVPYTAPERKGRWANWKASLMNGMRSAFRQS